MEILEAFAFTALQALLFHHISTTVYN